MVSSKKLLRQQASTWLYEIAEEKSWGRSNGCQYQISKMRQVQPRIQADIAEAEHAFNLEVIASLIDPVVKQIMSRTEH